MMGYADANDMLRGEGPDGVREWFDEDHARARLNGHGDDSNDRVFGLPMLDPSTLQGKAIPVRPWLVPGLIPARQVTELDGDGGTGKSLLAMQLTVAVATNRRWIGRDVTPGRVLYMACEDEADELHRRLVDICQHYLLELTDLGNIRFATMAGEVAVLATPPAKVGAELEQTNILRWLRNEIERFRPSLLVLDTRADLFGGNQNDAVQTRQFITMLRGLAMKFDMAILLLSHPSLTGMSSGRGSSGTVAWRNSVRSALTFTRALEQSDEAVGRFTEPDPRRRLLDVKKSNYGSTGGQIALVWENGVFEVEETTAAVTSFLDKKVSRTKAEETFLALLATFIAQGREASSSTGRNYAPFLFAKEPGANGFRKAAFEDAMRRLFDAGRIIVEVTGPASRQKKTLAIVPRNEEADDV